ncbi:hypothetical protein CAP39_07895 [Sphingomonas sp. IBVSS1]|nr:hypothetical protein CAP39_07895 [Sphingomonas sp. IBVSS1]
MRRRQPAVRRWLAAACALLLAAPGAAAPPPASVFDDLFGSDPAAERAGPAADGLALPGLFAAGRRLADTLPLHDLGPGKGSCLALIPLLEALELAHAAAADGITVTLPDPQRTIHIPAGALLASPSGACLPLTALPDHLPLAITHDPASQRLLLDARAPLPVLMRLDRLDRQARLRPDAVRPAFALRQRPAAAARLWSLDIAASLDHSAIRSDAAMAVQGSGELFGLAARAAIGLSARTPFQLGFTLADARDTPDLLGPLGARSLAIGDIASPAQPLIADALSGRGLLVSSRPPWRADLVDEIDLSGPLPVGWEAELWHEDRLVAVARTPDPAGQWRFAGLPVRLGENRWVVRLYGPYGERSEQQFTRLVGTEMNAENEVDYSIGFVDGGQPLWGIAPVRGRSGAAGFASFGWGIAPALTARLGLRAPLAGDPALSLGLHGAHAGTLWAATLARDGVGGLGGAVRLARRLVGTDLLIDAARHGRDAGPAQSPLVREFASLASISGQGRRALGRFSLPWQLRLQTAERRSGGTQQALSTRLAIPLNGLQANAGLALVRQGGTGWQGNAQLGLAARTGQWRLRAGLDALVAGGWRLAGATLSAARTTGRGAINLDLGWQPQRRSWSGGLSVNRRLGAFGLSAGVARGSDGWRLGLGLVVGLWQAGGRWHTAPAGLTRSGAIAADLFIDDDGDGRHDPDEAAVAGGRFIVANSVRGETTGADGAVLLRSLPAGTAVDIETQLSSLDDFNLRPTRPGDRVQLRPGEVRPMPMPLQRTGSIDAQVVLVNGDIRTPRAGINIVLCDQAGRPVGSAISDFEGHVLFEGLALAPWTLKAGTHSSPTITLSRENPNQQTTILIAPLGSTSR